MVFASCSRLSTTIVARAACGALGGGPPGKSGSPKGSGRAKRGRGGKKNAGISETTGGRPRRGGARPLFVSLLELAAIGLSECIEERAQLHAQIVGEAARGEVEVCARLLPLRFAHAIDPAVLQRREHAEGDHEEEQQCGEWTTHPIPSLTRGRRRARRARAGFTFLTKFLLAHEVFVSRQSDIATYQRRIHETHRSPGTRNSVGRVVRDRRAAAAWSCRRKWIRSPAASSGRSCARRLSQSH